VQQCLRNGLSLPAAHAYTLIDAVVFGLDLSLDGLARIRDESA